MFSQITVVAFFSALAAAQLHVPTGEPLGNPIAKPGLLELVPACKPYTITWDPTTFNTISLLLLRGPSENAVPFGAPLAEGIENTGTFVWTPASSLEADDDQYGLQLIDDKTGQFQYSTQFGISKDDCEAESSSPSGHTPTATVTASVTGGSYPTESSDVESSSSIEVSSSAVYTPSSIAITSFYSASTGYPIANSSIILPSKSMTVPSSLLTTATASATTTGLPESTGAASPLRAGLGLAGAVAAAIFML